MGKKSNNGGNWMEAYEKDKGWLSGNTDKPAGSSWKNEQRCFHTHPALKIGEHLVYGGSCSTPVHDDCDIYIGLDYTMAEHKQRLPWEPGHSIHYKIQDMGVPTNPVEFKSLITWLAGRIENGDKAHIGCIGGHGRTGMVLSALVAHMTAEADAITYVRENYCKKVVESNQQVEFLMTHFGCVKVKAAKTSWSSQPAQGSRSIASLCTTDRDEVSPIKSRFCLWGEDIKPEIG